MEKLFTYAREKLKQWKKQLLSQEKQTNHCKSCFKEIKQNNLHNIVSSKEYLCSECLRKMRPVFKEFKIEGINVLSVFEYTDVIKEKLFLFKGCRDYELKDVFIKPFRYELEAIFKNYIFIPMPSYYLNDEERGFNHVVEMFDCFGDRIHRILYKTANIKQANLNSEERANINKHIQLLDNIDTSFYQNKKICLIDDVCTTGSTLKSAIELVKNLNPKTIKILVMASTVLEKTSDNKNKVFI